jgi:hypothetical protein
MAVGALGDQGYWERKEAAVRLLRFMTRRQRDRTVQNAVNTVTADQFVKMYRSVTKIDSRTDTTDLDNFFFNLSTVPDSGFASFSTPADFRARDFEPWSSYALSLMKASPQAVQSQRQNWAEDNARSHVIVAACGGNNLLADIAAARILVMTLRDGKPFDAMYFVDAFQTTQTLLDAVVGAVSDFGSSVAKEKYLLKDFTAFDQQRGELKNNSTLLGAMDAYVGFNVQYAYMASDPRQLETDPQYVAFRNVKNHVAANPAIFCLTAVSPVLIFKDKDTGEHNMVGMRLTP